MQHKCTVSVAWVINWAKRLTSACSVAHLFWVVWREEVWQLFKRFKSPPWAYCLFWKWSSKLRVRVIWAFNKWTHYQNINTFERCLIFLKVTYKLKVILFPTFSFHCIYRHLFIEIIYKHLISCLLRLEPVCSLNRSYKVITFLWLTSESTHL